MKTWCRWNRVVGLGHSLLLGLLVLQPYEARADTPYAWPSHLFQEYFDMGDLHLWGSPGQRGGGTVTLSAEQAYSGQTSLKCSIPSGKEERNAYVGAEFEESAVVHARFSFFVNSDLDIAPANYTDWVSLAALATPTTGALVFIVLRKSGSAFSLGTYSFGGIDVRGSTAIAPGTWYTLEIAYTTGATNGGVEVRLDGAMEMSASNLKLPTRPSKLIVGADYVVCDAHGSFFIDDVFVSRTPLGYADANVYLIHTDLRGRVGATLIALLSGAAPTDQFHCDLSGAVSRTVLKQSGPLPGRVEIPLDLRGLSPGKYTLTATLANASGVSRAKASVSFDKSYSADPVVSLDARSNFVRGGTPFFPVLSFGLSRNDMRLWKSAHFINTLCGSEWNDKLLGATGYKQYLDAAQANGLLGVGPAIDYRFDFSTGIPWTNDAVREYVQTLGSHPANGWWLFREEPDNWNYSASTYKAWWDMVKQYNADHLSEILLMGYSYLDASGEGWQTTMRSYHWPYLVSDVYSWDIYPIEHPEDATPLADFAEAVDRSLRWNWGLVPVLPNIQSADCTPGEGGGTPTPDQILQMCWLSVVHGAKGIHWYPYQGLVSPENYGAMAEFTQRTQDLSDVLAGGWPSGWTVSDDANTGGKRVDTMLRQDAEGRTYLIAVRLTEVAGEAESIDVQFTLAGASADAEVKEYRGYGRVHEDHGGTTAGASFSFTLAQTPVTPDTVLVSANTGGESLDPDGNRADFTWVFDNGKGVLQQISADGTQVWDVGSVDYASGSVSLTFQNPWGNGVAALQVPAGTTKVRAVYAPELKTRTLPVVGGVFRDSFARNAVHIYRLADSRDGGAGGNTGGLDGGPSDSAIPGISDGARDSSAAATPDRATTKAGSKGCSCSLGRQAKSAGPAVLLVLLLAALLGSRKRRLGAARPER